MENSASASSSDSFTGSGMHPEVTYTVRIDGVSVNAEEIVEAFNKSLLSSTPYCRICRYGEFESDTENVGRCRRNSPVPDRELGTANWPIVAWNDWCGDWVHR